MNYLRGTQGFPRALQNGVPTSSPQQAGVAPQMAPSLSEHAAAQLQATVNASRPGPIPSGQQALKTTITRLQQQNVASSAARSGAPSPPASAPMQQKNSMPPPAQQPATPMGGQTPAKVGGATPVRAAYLQMAGFPAQAQEYPFSFHQVLSNTEPPQPGSSRPPSSTPKMGETKPPTPAPGSSTFAHSTIPPAATTSTQQANGDGADDNSPSLSRPSPSTSGGGSNSHNPLAPTSYLTNGSYDPSIYLPSTQFGGDDFGSDFMLGSALTFGDDPSQYNSGSLDVDSFFTQKEFDAGTSDFNGMF